MYMIFYNFVIFAAVYVKETVSGEMQDISLGETFTGREEI